MLYEAANILRRHRLSGALGDSDATMAHRDLMDLPVHFEAYRDLSVRIWELRHNVTCYDAAYVAIAEFRDIPLVTLDKKLAQSREPRCHFLSP